MRGRVGENGREREGGRRTDRERIRMNMNEYE